MKLPHFVITNLEPLVEEWETFARTQLPAAQNMSSSDLRDHAGVMLREIAQDMASYQDGTDAVDKSRGDSPNNSPSLTLAAREHAMQRFSQGFTLNQLVSEFRALRAAVIRRWTIQRAEVSAVQLDELVRFGEAMDQAVSESVSIHLEQIERARNLLLGVLGHDLRNPLGAVQMSAHYLLLTDGLDVPQLKAANRIARSSTTMINMVNRLLDFTQTVLMRTMPLKRESADLGDICLDVVTELLALHPARNVQFAAEGDLSGSWDASRINQVLSNLTANAIQHGDPNKPVQVQATGQASAVVVSVRNDGEPISEEASTHLFEPLISAPTHKSARQPGSSGLGLGLYIAHQIVLAHGGSIGVVSTVEDGTTFTVHLPRKMAGG